MSTLIQPVPFLAPVTRSRPKTNTLLVLALALLSRVFVAWYSLVHFPPGWLFTRGMEMDLLAKSLLAGNGLSSPFGPATGPTAIIAPAYPIFLAAVFRLFGIDTVASSLVVMGVHIALNLATVWLILHLARRFAHEDAAVLAAAFWAGSLPLVWMPTILWETSFSAFFLLGGLALALDLTGTSSRTRWAACGCGCAIAGLFNPALLPSLLALFAWAAYKTSRLAPRKPAIALAAFLVVVSPWPIRNARVFHALILTRTTVGFELWMGNRPGATGFLDESLFPAFNPAELADYRRRGELAYFARKAAIARDYIHAHPTRFVQWTAVRIERYWTGTGNSKGSLVFALHALLTTLLGMAGVLRLARSSFRGQAISFTVPLVLFPLPYYATHAEFKYRLILDPLLCVLAAYALHPLPNGKSPVTFEEATGGAAAPLQRKQTCHG